MQIFITYLDNFLVNLLINSDKKFQYNRSYHSRQGDK